MSLFLLCTPEKCLSSLTSSGLAPEIAMWRLYTDEKAGEEDWYIKPNVYVSPYCPSSW